ncbi:oligosaccharide flippase family protein [Pontibacter rugosus]
MKATSIFGGVQVGNILINIIRSKFIAVLLGPTGMGIAGLLTATLNIVTSLTNFGLSRSAVKNVAAANATNDIKKISVVVTVLRKLVWATGLLGSFITLVTAPLLSELTFGNDEYTYAFIWLAFTLLLRQLSAGQLVVLQGMRKIKFMAKGSFLGSVLGLVVSVPVYYLMDIDGIVPAIILTSFISLFISWHFSNKIKVSPTPVDIVQLKTEGGEMLRMGFMLSLSSLAALGASYIIRIFISRNGGIDQVGLYNAGFAIVNTYVGMIFTAMVTDYYPRLSAVAQDRQKATSTINQQAEVAILILAPLLLVFLIFIDWAVILLYSTKFIPVNGMIHWSALGIFFKAVSWAIAYIILANGSSKLFFWNELVVNIYMLLLNILGYYWGGLTGLGISFLASYILYTAQVYFLTKSVYGFRFSSNLYNIFIIQFF